MSASFLAAFQESFFAVAKIALVVLAAGMLVRRKILVDHQIRALSDVTIYVFLPCLIFSNISGNLEPGVTPYWWALPLFAVGLAAFGFLLAWIFFHRELPQKSNLLAVSALQNAGYMILPIGQVLVPEAFDQFALYVFLYILGFNLIVWSVGKQLISRTGPEANRDPFTWKGLITPPLVANLTAIFLVLTGLRRWIPEPVSDSIELLGQATVPVGTFVLGASLGSIPILWRTDKRDTLRVVATKLFLIPAAMWFFLKWSGLAESEPLLALFLMLEAAAAPATSLILVIRTYGGDLQKVGTIYVICYLSCLFTIPFWIAMLEYAR